MSRSALKCLVLSSVLLCLSVQARGEEGWPEAMVAFRERVLSPDKSLVKESVWHTTGPMKSDNLGVAFFPEKGVDLNAVDARGKKLWRPAPQYKNKVVNALGGFNGCVTYLYRTIRTTKPLELQIRMGSNYGLAAWHNGRMLLRGEVERPTGPHDVRNVRLVPGENKVLLKVYNRSSKHAFYYEANPFMNTRDWLWRNYGASNRIFEKHFPNHRNWFTSNKTTELERAAIKRMLAEIPGSTDLETRLARLIARRTPPASPEWLRLFEDSVRVFRGRKALKTEFAGKNPEALKRALDDLVKTYPRAFRDSATLSRRVAALVAAHANAKSAMDRGDVRGVRSYMKQSADLQREILLRNPALDFDRILLVKRKHDSNGSGDYFNFRKLGLPQNWQGNSSIPKDSDNEIAALRYKKPGAPIETVYRPKQNHFVGDVDLHFGAKKMLFSSIGTHGRWQIFEVNVDGTGLRQVSSGEHGDVDDYDPMYLPNGRIIYDSTSCFQGVPCVAGSDHVANLHMMNADGSGVRRLCFDQDNDWCPTMLPNGRVLYLRWEYTDTAHYFTRIMFHMNPDGTNQSEFYGSNSYWPNSLFYARPFPGSSSKFVGIVGGHHGVPRMGELVLFDTSKGRQEASGVIQRIPGYGKPVAAPYRDALVENSWPKFLHPFPLGNPSKPGSVGKYFLVSCKPAPGANWGIYLVDVFDNMLLLKETPSHALFEPVPLKKTPVPPVIPDRVNLKKKTATVYLQDIYRGRGLAGVAPGTVKSLRIVQYEFAYRNLGGHFRVGLEGPWDVHCVVGTVPVFKDGSAVFEIPANTPVAVQPLDAEGKALQQMRSWFVGMPGEVVSCVGCHERQNMTPLARQAEASRHRPAAPKPWYGKKRGFNFLREVQPVLDKYCVGCHDNKKGRPNFADTDPLTVPTDFGGGRPRMPKSYLALHPYVRRNGPEGNNYVLTPLEFHVNTSTLFQMLRKGHNNVKLDREAWDRLITWVDLNVPAYGSWQETRGKIPADQDKRRSELMTLYAGVSENMALVPREVAARPAFIKPRPMPPK
ncbi:MAG: HzsA-related protein, partial [Planctomycetota bacterium]